MPGIVKQFVITAFYTGCRLGELVNLRWENVNLTENIITIGDKNFTTKTRKQRIIPIHPRVAEVLSELQLSINSKRSNLSVHLPSTIKHQTSFVFAKSNSLPYTKDYFSRNFKRACRKAGIDEDIHFHSLRHSAATGMINKGAPVPSVQKILGHANIATTMLYTHPDLNSLRDAISRL